MLIVLVTDAGGVSQRVTALPEMVDETDLAVLRARLSALITGQAVSEAAERLQSLLDDGGTTDAVLRTLSSVVIDELGEFRQERLVMAGAATLARRGQDFRGSIHPLLEAIEEQVTLLRLMSEMEADAHGLSASIGTENAPFGLGEASIVASDYAAPGGTARVGVMGPTRMDYPSNLAAARAVARDLSRMLDEDEASR
jgi:heat-inducible transcriptional repressor